MLFVLYWRDLFYRDYKIMDAPSLNGFLTLTGAHYRLFDLGVAVRKLPESTLLTLDEGRPYPMPHMGFAWLVIFMWNPELKEQNSLWFMKLPLDEQGMLNVGVHSDLVNRLYKSLQTQDPKERQRLLTDHPYQFKPDDQRMAALHANATKILGLPASHYVESATDFYQQSRSDVEWASLGIQGIADFVLRLTESQFKTLNGKLKNFPTEAFLALTAQLEHRALPTGTVQALLTIARQPATNIEVKNACLRAAALSPSIRLFDPLAIDLMADEQATIETVLILLTRYRHLLKETKTAAYVLHRLSTMADADGFNRVVTNLTMQHDMDRIVARILGSDHLTEALANSLSRLIQQTRRPTNG